MDARLEMNEVANRRAHYITKLPKAEHDAEEWQAAREALLLVAEQDRRDARATPA